MLEELINKYSQEWPPSEDRKDLPSLRPFEISLLASKIHQPLREVSFHFEVVWRK